MLDTAIEFPFVVRLDGAEGLPADQRMRAETRYSAALQKALGGPDKVAEAYRAFQATSDNSEAPRGEQLKLATAWQKACGLAQQAGKQGMGDDTGAYFEIRLH